MAGLRGVIVDIAPLRVSPDYRRLWGADLVASAVYDLLDHEITKATGSTGTASPTSTSTAPTTTVTG